MPNPLLPALDGRRLSVDLALNTPTVIRDRIAQIADRQLVMPVFFHHLGAQVEGGGMLYSIAKAGDLYVDGVERRSPGAEYHVVEGVQPSPKVATVEDWGGKFQVLEEHRIRNNTSYVDNQTTQLANTVVKRVDNAAFAAVAAADIDDIVATRSWDGVVLDGATPTAASERPTGSLALILEAFEVDDLGVVPDTIVVNPAEARVLRQLYGKDLAAVLDSFGLKLRVASQVEAGSAYVVQSGEVGVVGFERALTTEVYPDRATRSDWVQTYCVPAFAVEKPYAAKKLVGLA